MNRNKLTASLTLCAALTFSGCAGASGNSAGGNGNAGDAAPSRASAADNSPSVGSAANESAPAVPASPAPPASSVSQPTSQTSATTPSGAHDARAANAPKPRIGSGGNDFYLFTQARAALAADAELKGANFVIEVKEGVLTLGGAAASAEQKSRAEEVVRGVGGVKSVRNQIKVSGGS